MLQMTDTLIQKKLFGIDGASLAADSHTNTINFIETVVSEEKIECDFERLDGYLFLGPGEHYIKNQKRLIGQV